MDKKTKISRTTTIVALLFFSVIGTYTLLRVFADAAVYTVPSSIAADCSSDVTSELNSFIASVPDNSTINFGQNACYETDTSILIVKRNNLVLDGNNATFKRIVPTPPALLYPNWNMHWTLEQDNNITIENMHIQGLNTVSGVDPKVGEPDPSAWGSGYGNKAFESGFVADSDNNLVFQNLTIDGTYGDGITLGGESSGLAANNVTINNVTINRVGRMGLGIVSANNVVITNTQILHPYENGIDIEPNGATASDSNIEINNSTISSYKVLFSASGAQNVSDIYFHNNTIGWADPSWPWVYVASGNANSLDHDWRIDNNTVQSGWLDTGLAFTNVNNVQIENNSTVFNAKYPSVHLVGVGGVVNISNNNFTGATAVLSTAQPIAQLVECGNTYGVGLHDAACTTPPVTNPGPTSPTHTTSTSTSTSSPASGSSPTSSTTTSGSTTNNVNQSAGTTPPEQATKNQSGPNESSLTVPTLFNKPVTVRASLISRLASQPLPQILTETVCVASLTVILETVCFRGYIKASRVYKVRGKRSTAETKAVSNEPPTIIVKPQK